MYFFYSLILYLLMPLVLLRLVYQGIRNPDYLNRWTERLGVLPDHQPRQPIIWIHAVSVGEIHASRPLIEYLQSAYPRYRLLITTVTATGTAAARRLFADQVEHRWFPYDLPFTISRFLAAIKPRTVLIMETEIWPNLYNQCKAAGIPVALINARLSEKSMKGYLLFPRLIMATLNGISLIAAQTRVDAERFVTLGASPDNVQVTGNLKFDAGLLQDTVEQSVAIRQFLSVNRPVWIAASTHEGEEIIILDALELILAKAPDSLLILVPRHPQRFSGVGRLCKTKGFETVAYSSAGDYSAQTRIFILDVMGQLPAYYAAADIAFVGGSLVPVGGHNLLEPACLGLPVISGPQLFNFTEVSTLLSAADALITVTDAAQLAGKVLQLFADPELRKSMGNRAKAVVAENQGSVARLGKVLEGIIPGDD